MYSAICRVVFLPLALMFFMPAASHAAITYSSEGDIAPDIKSISLTVEVKGIKPDDLKSGASSFEYKQNLRVFLSGVSIDTPLRTYTGSEELDDFVNDFYWDLANAEVSVINQTISTIDLRYKFNIYENTYSINRQRLDELLDPIISPPRILVQIGFWGYTEDGTYEKVSQSTDITVQVNYSVATSDVNLSSVKSINKGVRVEWPVTSTTSYSDGKDRDTPKVLVTAFKKDTGTIDLSSASYVADTTGANPDVIGGGCTIDQSLVDSGSTCITGCSIGAGDQVYLAEDEMRELVNSGDILFSAYVPQDQNSLDLTGVTTGDFVGVFLQYERGVRHSTCLSAEVRENISLTEFNGEDPAKLKTSKCFIATAAFGSPFNSKVDSFRWFRDNYLLETQWGTEAVKLYYKYSPPLAKVIENNSFLKAAILAVLYPIYYTVEGVKVVGLVPMLAMLTLLMGLCALGYSRSLSKRKVAIRERL